MLSGNEKKQDIFERTTILKRRYYFIDTENVGDKWFGLLDKCKKKDRIITFYTENHSKRLEDFLIRQVNNPRVIWLECTPGNNALDYQLIGVLAYLVAKHPKAAFCIYSNDKGYQKTVDFWNNRGIQICQRSPNQKKKAVKKGKKKEKKSKKNLIPDITVQNYMKKDLTETCVPTENPLPVTAEQYVDSIAECIPISNLNGWYCALTVLLGQETGREWYQKIRQDAQMREILSGYFHGDKRKRSIRLITLTLHAYQLDTNKAQDAYHIIASHRCQNLGAIKIDFDKLTDHPSQQNYYKVLRPLIALLRDF